MSEPRKINREVTEENKQLRAQVAQLEDRIDHLSSPTAPIKALQGEALHREVMSAVSDAVLVSDEMGRLKYVSPNAHFIFGHSAADILKQGRVSFVLPVDLYDPDLLEQRGEIANLECTIRDSIGRARNLLVTVRRFGGYDGMILHVCRDVSERVRIEQDYKFLSLTLERRVDERVRELRENRDRYRRLVEGLRDEYLFYATDPAGTITYVSPSIHNILGYTPDQVLGHNWREFVDTTTAEFAELEKMERMRFADIPTPPFSAWILHAKGHDRLLEFRDAPLRDADGHVVANEGIGKDITERHQACEDARRARAELQRGIQEATAELVATNEELRKSQELYRSVIQDHLEFIIRWRDAGIRTFVNDAYCRYLKSTPEALLGTSFMSAIVEDDKQVLCRLLGDLSTERPVIVHEHRVVRPDGSFLWERWTHRALFNEDHELIEYQSVGCDATERRKREEIARERDQASAQLRALTDREHDVLRLVVAGDANKVMARKLGLSIKTIEKHRSSLMKKLHVRSVPDLVRLAMFIDESINL
jgi:PAS domain S-box-containing protein